MSRGAGVWQRRILNELEHMTDTHICWVTNVVREHVDQPERKDFVAARRAAKRLSEIGKIRVGLFRYIDEQGHQRDSLAFTRPESTIESNIYLGNNLTPSWHTTVPAKYANNHQEWNPKLVTDP